MPAVICPTISLKAALKDGYKNAFSAIFDSNFTSIITGIILFVFGTGPIRGFATTLMIGIVCSFFTAVFLTRLVYEHFLNKDKLTNLTFTTPFAKKVMPENTHINFMGARKTSFIVFGILLVVFAVAYGVRGFDRSIDFTGGRNFTVQFEQPVQPEQVSNLLQDQVGGANLSVIALGTDGKTLRISTNYRINDSDDDIDTQIEQFLFDALKNGKLLSPDLTFNTFIDHENRAGGSIISSQKVGPSIASDITRGAIISVILALIAIFLYILLRFRNVAYSVGAISALVIDTAMILGMYALQGGRWGLAGFPVASGVASAPGPTPLDVVHLYVHARRDVASGVQHALALLVRTDCPLLLLRPASERPLYPWRSSRRRSVRHCL